MSQNLIGQTLVQNISRPENVFVFPTQIACDLWADWTIQNSAARAVAMERFIPWDDFKATAIRSEHQDKNSIPGEMRKIFAIQLIQENAKSPFLNSIIPQDYAKTAGAFANWIATMLSSLAIWKKYFDKNSASNPIDDEDKDILEIYKRYQQFLDKYSLFDPAWEKPPFKADNKHYFVFFPEILTDYEEYRAILQECKDFITIVSFEGDDGQPVADADFFTDSRTEIKNLAIKIREAHDKNKIEWDKIAVNVPDMESYGPYIDRELELYSIPHVVRSARPLSQTAGGSLFNLISECVNENFSFSSLKNLLLTIELPWADSELNDRLISFGQNNNCLCNFELNGSPLDIWEKTFDSILCDKSIISFYRNLKHALLKITGSKSFEEIRDNYFSFREKFFDMDKCSDFTDKIISRCIIELGGLIDLEKVFSECSIPDPYNFFVSLLDEKVYLEQANERGVQILPYKTGSSSPFDCHFIVDASQASTSIIYKSLSFLREDKRLKILGGLAHEDPNVTRTFLRLYKMNSLAGTAYFSCAAKTFTGYSQTASDLTENDFTKNPPDFLNKNSFSQEKDWYLEKGKFPESIYSIQQAGAQKWLLANEHYEVDTSIAFDAVDKIIKTNRMRDGENCSVSYSAMQAFFECPYKYCLNRILHIKELNQETDLMDRYSKGNLNHKVLELYFNYYKENHYLLPTADEILSKHNSIVIYDCLDKAINDDENSPMAKFLLNTTRVDLLQDITEAIQGICERFFDHYVYAVEENFTFKIPSLNAMCEGKVDLLLQDPTDGELILIDHKTSKAPAKAELYYSQLPEGEILNFQMPMYYFLLENTPDLPPLKQTLFYKIKERKFTEFKSDNIKLELEYLQEKIKVFVQAVSDGNILKQRAPKTADCYTCEYKALCRHTFNVGKSE